MNDNDNNLHIILLWHIWTLSYCFLSQDSNQFHAICLDTYPPICYLNETSKQIIQLVTRYNEIYGQVKAAYTFDAGPNAVLFTLSENTQEMLSVILHAFPPSSDKR